MAMLLAGRPAAQVAALLGETLQRAGPAVENWDTRAALLWVLVVAERFGTVEESLKPLLAQVHRSGSARGFVAAYSTLGLLRLRLGALPEAEAAARVALRVLQEGDMAPGLGFAATVLSDIAVDAGELDEAQTLLDLLPQEGWPAGVATVLIPAARGRLRLAQGRAADALADFQACEALFGADAWGMPIRDTGYVHARSGAALALLRLGQRQHASQLADAELADVRVFGAPRSLGISLRAAGLARGGNEGLALLRESVAALDGSPAQAPGGMTGQGKAACAQFFADWWDAFPDARVDVRGVHIAGDIVTEEGTFTGTHHGTLHSPAGDIPPTGRPVAVEYIHVLRYRDGMHVSFNLIFDRLAMLDQLGLLPAAAPAG